MKDNYAIAFGGLCLLHCLATPVLLAMGALGRFTDWLESTCLHQLFLVPVIILALLSLPVSFFRHGSYLPIAMAAVGITAMYSSLYLPENAELWVVVPAALLIIWAHLWNKQLLVKCQSNVMVQANG